jgi:serine/threonine protein kinase/Tol biopolymer transport system component
MTGETVTHYRIYERLGGGAMGVVYRAKDLRLGRSVAIKFLHQSSPAELVQRFQREARASSALNHPHICTVFDVGDYSGRPFLVMEYLDGKTLAQLLHDQRFSIEQIVDIGTQIADGLEAAHAAGVVHRDIKPANIFVTERGQAKILDFGLAKLAIEERAAAGAEADTQVLHAANLTMHGMAVGTVAYMSPEQALGEQVDARSDLFSLGVVLYEMAAGDLPFRGPTSAAVFNAILHLEPEALVIRNPRIPTDLDQLIQNALEKDRELRTQTAAELKADLRRTMRNLVTDRKGSSSSALHAQPSYDLKTRPQGAVSRRSLIIAGSLGGAAIFSAGFGIYRSFVAKRPPAEMRAIRATSSGRVNMVALSPDGRRLALVIEEAGKQRLAIRQVSSGNQREIDPAGDFSYVGLTYAPDGDAVYYVRTERGRPGGVFRASEFGGDVRAISDRAFANPSVSRDGKEIAFLRFGPSVGTELVLARSDGSEPRVLANRKLPQYYRGIAISPDGKLIACSGNSFEVGQSGNLVGVPTGGGTEKELTSKRWRDTYDLAWLPDAGGIVLVANEDPALVTSQLWLVHYPSGKARPLTNDANDYSGISISADGNTLATVQTERRARIQLIGSRNVDLTSEDKRNEGVDGLCWHGLDRVLYVSRQDLRNELWSAPINGGEVRRIPIGEGSVVAPVVATQTREIAFGSIRGDAMHIFKMNADGSSLRQLTVGKAENLPAITPDGKTIFYVVMARERAQIMKQTEGKRAELAVDLFALNPAVSPDGAKLAFLTQRQPQNWNVGFLPIAGGNPTFLPYSIRNHRQVQWKGNSMITFVDDSKGTMNIVGLDIRSGAPEKLTNFEGRERIFSHSWSAAGDLAVSRGPVEGDVVLITNFQSS